ncbi:Gag-Pol polyprotein [Labeo rohita]|uniref:ribonuclease H n=1 Tax=Labeo rohita TaxID=84645 RepID=A0ABQ8L7G5_LABRO|nr:Gag-Pol polyprotein [Labeo rohita]
MPPSTPQSSGCRGRIGVSLCHNGQPPEPILPLATRAEAWQAIPGVSEWVMGIIKRGYSLRFARRPPHFSGVVPTLVVSKDAHVLRSEVMILLEKGAVEVVHPAQSESGFYSRYFLVPKKDGGLRPILDLRHLNRALMKHRAIQDDHIEADPLAHTPRGLDAYFHIQIAPHHRRFLRFAFEGVAYQYTVLPFGLSLAPRTFTKCMDAALSPLRQKGIRILNYLDNWLVLAQSEAELLSHRALLLNHLDCLGLKVNLAKSALHPSRRISFLGAVFSSTHMRTIVVPGAGSGNTAARGLVQNRSFSPPQKVSKDARPYGLSIPSARVGPAAHAASSALAETSGSVSCMASRTFAYQGGPGLCRSPDPLEELAMDGERRAPGYGLQKEGGHDRRFQHGSEGAPCAGLLGQHDCGVLYKSPGGTFLQAPLHSSEGPSGVGSAQPVFTEGNTRTRQTEPRCGYVIAKQRPFWGMDASSAGGPEDLGGLWQGRGRPLRLRKQFSLPNVLFKGQGRVGPQLAQPPPVCFSPDILDSSSTQVSQGTETQAPSGGPSLEKPALVLRTVPAARSSPLAHSPETRPPLSGGRDNMAPQAQAVGPAPLVPGWEPVNLSESVLNTISQARAPSTRRLYALKWSVFSAWCSTRGEDSISCDISVILSFLQELLDKGRSPSTLKVYVAAIAASHAPIAGQSVGRNNLVVRFLKGSRRLNPPRPHTIPTWDLSTLALASVKRMGDLQALSVSPSCLEFGPGDSKVILKLRHGYVPKVPSTPFRAQVITLSALPPSEEDQELNLLCPVRALRMYIERSASFRQSEQLFVCFGGRNKGHPVTKQRLSRWIVDAITLAYSFLGLQCPIGVRAHSTRGMASSWAWSSGVSIAEICAAAGWASPSTFTRFYNLDVPALQARVLSV